MNAITNVTANNTNVAHTIGTHMSKHTMRKSEQLTAESVIPQLFADIMLRDMYSNCTISNKQIIAAAMFKTMFNMEDAITTTASFNDMYTKANNYLVARNRDLGVMVDAADVLESLVLMGFMDELGGVFYVSQKFYDACYVSEKTAPLTTMITDAIRRVSQVKGGKVKPSKLLDKAMRYLEATPFSAEMDMATIINLVKSQTPELAIWKDVKGSMNGINDMEAGVDHYSEQKADKRGRMYHVAHAGTNPQGDDYNRSIYKLNVESIVRKDDEAYTYFMNELEEAAGKDPKYMATEYLMRVGKSPVRALKTFLECAGVDSPFMYVRLARYFVTFEEAGECDVRVPMGLDAKCSGTQILAILAGNKQLLEATGFTSKKVFDPYALCAIQMDMAGIDRNAMKTPYMAIQYGGGVTALVNQKDYMQVMFDAGIENAEEAADITIEAVKRVLGNKIIGLQDYMAEQITRIMEESGKTNVVYTHIDGQIVDLVVCGKVELTATFTSIRYTQNTIISFGSQLKNTGLTVSDKTPSADEYARTFMVNYIQGIDALIARTVASLCEDAGIEGYVSIHDCFRTALKDTAKLKAIICRAYEIIFIENDPVAHLCNQLNIDMPMVSRELTSEMIYNKDAYFFC